MIQVVYPAEGDLLDIPGWGLAPANQVWIFVAEGAGRETAVSVASALGGRLIGEIALLGAYQVETGGSTKADLLSALDRATTMDGVHLALPHHQVARGTTMIVVEPCDPTANANYRELQGRPFRMIGLADAWRMIRASGLSIKPVHVGVLDSALWPNSGDLNHAGGPRAAVLSASRDLATAPAVGQDSKYALTHATMVAHVIAADHRVGGPVGVASVLGSRLTLTGLNLFDGVPDWIPIRSDSASAATLSQHGQTYLVKELLYTLELVAAGATVINCSFGPDPLSADTPFLEEKRAKRDLEQGAWERLLNRLEAKFPDVLVVAAAGNDNLELSAETSWGHRAGNLLTVGACDLDGARAEFSNKSSASGELRVDIAAPGTSVVVGVATTGMSHIESGTSLAAPMVSGAAALLRSIKSDLTAAQIKTILIQTGASSVRNLADTQTVNIPESIGGKLLRVDDAVLYVVNLVRKGKGQPELTREQLLALGGFTVSVAGGPADYTVKAAIPAVGDVPADVTLEVTGGSAAVAGTASHTVSAPGDAAWTVRRTGSDQDLLTIKITRMPSEACAWVRIPYSEPTQLGNTIGISVKANVDFARATTPGTYDSGTILTVDIPAASGAKGYAHTFTWAGSQLAARHQGDNPTAFVTETITAEASSDGTSLLWLELVREERSRVTGAWSSRVTSLRLENLPMTETGTTYRVQLDRDALASRMIATGSFRRTIDSSGGVIGSWVVMRCNSLTLELRKAP